MKQVLLFGATGNLGREIAIEIRRQGHELTAVVRSPAKANMFAGIANRCIIAEVTKPNALINICKGFDIVISSLGKSVSPNEKSKPSFQEIDFKANSNILEEAIRSGIQKFVYVSALHAEKYLHLEYFKVHHDFSEKLMRSGLNYSIIKPPAIFSAFLDVVDMARKGKLLHLGKGDKKTNPIYEGDLAAICVNAIREKNAVIEAGGKEIYTRKQLNEMVQQRVNPNKKIRTIPPAVIKFLLPLLKLADKNLFDKFSFFAEVMQHDILGPQTGEMTFQEYLRMKT